MSLNDVQATKRKLVEDILANDLYMPDSGVYIRLRYVLLKLSKDDLGMLKLFLEHKGGVRRMEARSEAWARANPGAVMRAEQEEHERKLRDGEI